MWLKTRDGQYKTTNMKHWMKTTRVARSGDTCTRRLVGNTELAQHALDGLGFLLSHADRQLDPLGAHAHTTALQVRPPYTGLANKMWVCNWSLVYTYKVDQAFTNAGLQLPVNWGTQLIRLGFNQVENLRWHQSVPILQKNKNLIQICPNKYSFFSRAEKIIKYSFEFLTEQKQSWPFLVHAW